MNDNLSYILLFIAIIFSILCLKTWYIVRKIQKQQINLRKGSDDLPFLFKENLLDDIAQEYSVFISDLPLNNILQRLSVKYILEHVSEYSIEEELEALDYLYSKSKRKEEQL